MKLGIGVANFSWPGSPAEIGPTVARIARTADEAGLDSIWTMDHFFQIRMSGLPPEAPMLEAYATLAFIAGHTRRIRLGTLVTCVAYRHPGVLVKAVTSLDVLSGGRAIFGVGAGYAGPPIPAGASHEVGGHEVGGLGIPFPSLAERFERLEELLRIAHQMWRGDEEPFTGEHYQLGRPLNSPNSLQRPHPPILVGGGGERKTLRLVARYADACNLFPGPQLPGKLEVLRRHCEAEGRDYDEIEKTTAAIVDLSDDRQAGLSRLVDELRELADLGMDHVLLFPRSGQAWDDESLDAVASIVPVARGISARAIA
jgi:F420-dependent oxidoreductase-like protein